MAPRRKTPEKLPGDPRYRHIQVGDELDPEFFNRRNMPGSCILVPCTVLEVLHKDDLTLLTVNTTDGPKKYTAEWFRPIPQ